MIRKECIRNDLRKTEFRDTCAAKSGAILLGYPVLGIWYWCCDQTIVQRVLGAKESELFVITSAPEKFDALKAQFDTILTSYRTH